VTDEELKAFTPTERKILAVLADGERHSRHEFHESLDIIYVSDGDDRVLSVHICNMRDKLRLIGKWIVCEYYLRKHYYRLVNLVRPLMSIS
jgi:DNA-binding response OmpR family regulator